MDNAVHATPGHPASEEIFGRLGITKHAVIDAVRDGLAEGLRLDAAAPKIAPGFYAWTGTVASIRRHLVTDGWRPADKQNLPTIVSPDGRVRLIVASGDSGTGDPAATPSTSNPKGRAVEEHVRSNDPGRHQQIQLALDIDVESNRDESGACQTWMLLYRHDIAQLRSVAEVSLPLAIEGGRVTEWGDRAIIETPIQFPEMEVRPTDVSALDDVDFEIHPAREG
ncbi:hypothetical protein [uncultured Dietzia sp.]|uniref:hypothetical protein n=1 Tax=uncultured Dietzia sp. TaxID=395519 RepID=UPI0025E6D112|nr:hypothetical protein [uncultured Dietzia sp.]